MLRKHSIRFRVNRGGLIFNKKVEKGERREEKREGENKSESVGGGWSVCVCV